MSITRQLDQRAFAETLAFFHDLGLLTEVETDEVMAIFEPRFPFADLVQAADSVHCHVKVDDVDRLPHEQIRARGTQPVNEADGYVKYPFPGGINLIFSSIPIAEDDRLSDLPPAPPAVMDHKGIDLRQDTANVRARFDAIPIVASEQGWRHVDQGGEGAVVFCCHTQVDQKHWVFPDPDAARQSRPIEFAIGDLVVNEATMGCDLRPIDPAHPRAAELAAAASSSCASPLTECTAEGCS
jgi:hypothetical protein